MTLLQVMFQDPFILRIPLASIRLPWSPKSIQWVEKEHGRALAWEVFMDQAFCGIGCQFSHVPTLTVEARKYSFTSCPGKRGNWLDDDLAILWLGQIPDSSLYLQSLAHRRQWIYTLRIVNLYTEASRGTDEWERGNKVMGIHPPFQTSVLFFPHH